VPSLAVIPFVNVGGDTATEYFADGITDELATALGRMPRLRVAARSSAYRYKGRRDLDVRQVGRELDVDLVLTGTARRAAQRVRVSAQLSSATDGVEIWSETFDRAFDDLLALSDSLTADISNALSGQLAGAADSTAVAFARPQAGTTNPAAFDAYLQGKYSLVRRRAGLEGAAEEFSEAIERDPQFARAYAGLGTALALLSYFGDSQPPGRAIRSREAALTALRIDSTNAEAHVALGILLLTQHQWRDAQQSLERAIALEPSWPTHTSTAGVRCFIRGG
jgi:TolB-like protein